MNAMMMMMEDKNQKSEQPNAGLIYQKTYRVQM
jgi:hypothetical protein